MTFAEVYILLGKNVSLMAVVGEAGCAVTLA